MIMPMFVLVLILITIIITINLIIMIILIMINIKRLSYDNANNRSLREQLLLSTWPE